MGQRLIFAASSLMTVVNLLPSCSLLLASFSITGNGSLFLPIKHNSTKSIIVHGIWHRRGKKDEIAPTLVKDINGNRNWSWN